MWSTEQVEAVFRELYVPKASSPLRPEERRKIPELVALLPEIQRTGARSLVDAAAGRAPLGLMAARLLELDELLILEQEPARASRAQRLGEALSTRVEVRVGAVQDAAIWPERPELVVALHACGPASDAVIEACVRARARGLLLVPCCYADEVPFAAPARARLDALGVPHQAGLRRRLIEGLVDAERTLRLQAAGFEVQVVEFVSTTITPHNRLFRCRYVGPTRRADRARQDLATLRGEAPAG
jgi:hypothetical protein